MRYVVPGLLGICLCTAVILFGAVELNHALPVYGLAALLALIWAGKLFFAKTALWKPSPMHWPVLGFVAYTVLHYFLSPYEYLSRLELFQVALFGLMYFIVANNINRGRERTVVVSMLLVLGTLEAMYGIWQAYTKSDFVLNVERPSGYLMRGSGTYICPNHLAGLLEMILGLALARLALHRPADRHSVQSEVLSKVMLAYAVFAMLVGILFTVSRAGWVSTSIGLLVFLVWGGLKTRAMWARIGVGVAALCVFGLLILSVPKAKYTLATTLDAKDKTTLGLKDASMSGRTLLWGSTWKMIRDHPILGTGAGTWQWVHQKYRHPQMQFTADYAHNDILQMTSDYGSIGFGLVAATLILFYVQAGRLRAQAMTSEQQCFTVGAVLAVSILLVHSWFDFNLHIPANGLLFCTILGLVAGMEIPDGPHLSRPLKPVLRYLLGLVLIGVVAAGAYFIVPSARAVYYADLGSLEKDYLQWDAALDYFRTAIDYDPKYIRPRLKMGDIYRLQAEFRVGEDKAAERLKLAQKAIKHYRAAFALNPSRSDIAARLASVHELAGEFDKARESFDLALALDPNSAALYDQFGLFLRRRGQEAEALRAFETSIRLHGSQLAWMHVGELRATVRAD